MNSLAYDVLAKIILIGDSGVGKTSIMRMFVDSMHMPDAASTIGVDFKIKTIQLGGKKIKLQLWDTAGQEKFKAIVGSYYRGAHGILLVFDLTDRNSFLHLSSWLSEITERVDKKEVEVFVLGNKTDLSDRCSVSQDEINKFMAEQDIPLASYVEVSAKDNINIAKCFEDLVTAIVNKNKELSSSMKEQIKHAPRQKKCC
ncbi:Ras-related protein Rab-10 [Enteropsectra breve]|nr:Ras-related protein Rab-10 [Enteropsectra breve]